MHLLKNTLLKNVVFATRFKTYWGIFRYIREESDKLIQVIPGAESEIING